MLDTVSEFKKLFKGLFNLLVGDFTVGRLLVPSGAKEQCHIPQRPACILLAAMISKQI